MALKRIKEGPYGLQDTLIFSYAERAHGPLKVRKHYSNGVFADKRLVLTIVDARGSGVANAFAMNPAETKEAGAWMLALSGTLTGCEVSDKGEKP